MQRCIVQVARRRRARRRSVAGCGLALPPPTRRSRSSSTGWPAARTPASPPRVAEGYYKDAGLDVTLVQGNGSGNTAQLVANGRAQLAYADAVAVSQLIAKGAPMKIVATIYQSNPNAVMSLKKAGIKSVERPQGQEGRRAVGLVADDDAAAAPQGEQPEGVRHQHDRHAGRVDGAGAAAGTGRRGARLDRRLPDPGRSRRARSSTSTASPTTACRPSARRSSPATTYLKDNPDVVKKFIAASLKGWSFALDNPGQGDQGREDRSSRKRTRSSRPPSSPRSRRSSAAAARKYIGKAEDALWVEVAGAAVGSEAAAGRPGPEDATTRTTTCRPRRRCAPASRRATARERRHERQRTRSATRYADLHVGMAFRSPGRTITDADLVGVRRAHRRLLRAAHERRVRRKQPVRPPRRARHAGARLRARPHVGAHRRAARNGDRVPRHQRVEVRRADLHRRHDLRELPRSPSCATASRGRRRRSRRSTSRS